MSGKKDFYIPKIEDKNTNDVSSDRGTNNSQFEKFASSYSGYNVKDENVFPYVRYNNNAAQYEDLKDKHYRKKYEDHKAGGQSVENKYSPDRIPSYLRGEEPAITRRNIEYLKGEKVSDKELYKRDRENYSRYSDESGLNSEVKKNVNTVSQGIINQENYTFRKPENNINYVKPSRDERSTLVITKRNPEQNSYFDNPYGSNSQTSQPRYQEKPVYEQTSQSRYQEKPVYEQTSQPRYQEKPAYEQPYQLRYQEQSKYEQAPQTRYQESYDYQEKIRYEEVPQQSANQSTQYASNVSNDKYSGNRDNKKSFLSLENDENFYYDDIDIPLQPAKSNEIEELDSYNFNDQRETFDSKENEASSQNVKIVEKKPIVRAKKPKRKYKFPPLDILKKSEYTNMGPTSDTDFQRTTINSTLEEFRIGGHVVNVVKGPTVTQFEVKLDPGVKVGKIESISRNLQMNLASSSIRIEAPIPGKPTVGIEVPNQKKSLVTFGDLAVNNIYLNDGKPLNVVLGKKIDGSPAFADITDMPHALVAGRTGSGKTVGIHSIITSILYKATPEEVKLILVDPKRNELMYFDRVPHLASPIIDDTKYAAPALKWAVEEMERRNEIFRLARKRSISDYNEYARNTGDLSVSPIPYIVIIVDEFADLLMSAGDSFETNVQRICQKGRSAGIHMIIATQRPSVDVIKGTIKANIQARLAFAVGTQTDSFTILDHAGAEKLLGKGDMLYCNNGPDQRIQGSYISTTEIDQVVDAIAEDDIDYMFTMDDLQSDPDFTEASGDVSSAQDSLLKDVARHVVSYKKASMNQICRVFNIGYNRADSIMDALEKLGIVSPVIQGRPRSVLVDQEELERILNNNA